jgi:predicted small lipoprotein YifL
VNRNFRAFSSEVDTGSRQENASNQESRAPFRFNRNGKGSSPFSPRWAVVLLAASALALSGCGRKGPLDLPPTGSQSQSQSSGSQSPTAQSSATAPTDTDAQHAATPSLFNSTYGNDAPPVAAKGTKKPFILDPLLNSD